MATATTCDLCGRLCIFNNGAGHLNWSGSQCYSLDLCEEHGKELVDWI